MSLLPNKTSHAKTKCWGLFIPGTQAYGYALVSGFMLASRTPAVSIEVIGDRHQVTPVAVALNNSPSSSGESETKGALFQPEAVPVREPEVAKMINESEEVLAGTWIGNTVRSGKRRLILNVFLFCANYANISFFFNLHNNF